MITSVSANRCDPLNASTAPVPEWMVEEARAGTVSMFGDGEPQS